MAARQWMCRALWMVGLGLATGCVDDGVSMHVICPAAPTVDETSCTYEAGGDLCVVEGVLNLSSAPVYRLNLRVESGLKARARDVPPMAEPNGLQMATAEVELRYPNGDIIGFTNGAENPFRATVSGYVAPGGTVVVPVNVVTAAHIEALKKTTDTQIVAAVTLHGKTNGDVDIETAEYSWPIRLIAIDPDRARNLCTPGIAVCATGRGQDDFAAACTSNSAN